ncbi:MAG: tRNA uridine-5-carboxymethylaminomethyl(34) synthesis GTPase MnmE [Candidatus Cloacimonadota bacterium]|nr:tRNA uridine-5-carboxymethylaminomethyl(34) synthesis GTPase MnmE [Candidatus Cloacimonadota bacterium]
MEYSHDTISAISTPLGIGGISVIRISGDEAINVVSKIFKSKTNLNDQPSHKAIFGRISDAGKLVDEVLVTVFKVPHSYTGENVVEISCHGSTFITNQILQILLRDTRLAEPGEFTQRAFLNDKIGLTQAEAVGDLLTAKTKISHIAALQQYEGRLRSRIEKLLAQLTDFRTQLELEIDFLENDLDEIDNSKFINELTTLNNELIFLAKTGEEGLIIKDGLKVSLVGSPNVGKSSIFNSFLETERAIVTPIPGTTRDYLEEVISLNGYLVRIFDTAGLREATDQIEKIGIKRSYEIIEDSHKVLFVIDGDENKKEYDTLTKLVDKNKIIKVLNKSDKFDETELQTYKKKGYIICSTLENSGLSELKNSLLRNIEISEEELHSGILTNTRQISAVTKATQSVSKALESINNGMGYEFTAFDLKEASTALEEIIGKVTSDDILNNIFANFCIGK